jgi:hypothetical protein
MILEAFNKQCPVWVALVEGKSRNREQLGLETAEVDYRALDSERWYVPSYDLNSGQYRLVRSIPPNTSVVSNSAPFPPAESEYFDQFSVDKRETTTVSFMRNSEVRKSVLNRAGGGCELCGSYN